MKRCAARILLAFLTFAIGTGVAFICKRWFAQPAARASAWGAKEIVLPEISPPQTREQTEYPIYDSISPYEIKRLIESKKQEVNQGLRGDVGLETIWKNLGLQQEDVDFLSKCHGNCQADILTLELDSQPGKEVVLKIQCEDMWQSRFLIFKYYPSQTKGIGAWSLLGCIDYNGWWSTSEHKVVTAGTKHWLVFTYISGHGSGYGRQDEDWYEVDESGVRQVLTYPESIFVAPFGAGPPGVQSKTKILEATYAEGVATVVLRLSNSYKGYQARCWDNSHLFTAHRKITFIKEPGSAEFIFDASRSELPAEEFANFCNFGDGYDWTGFLKYNYTEISKMAAGKDAKRRQWLQDFLVEFDDSVEKEALQKALDYRP